MKIIGNDNFLIEKVDSFNELLIKRNPNDKESTEFLYISDIDKFIALLIEAKEVLCK